MKRCVNEITQLRDDIDQHRKVCKYSVHVRWLKFNQIIRHSFTTIVSVLALIAGAPIHPAIRLEPHGLLFFFLSFSFSSILDHTEKRLSNQSSTQEARVWLVRSQSTLLSEQSQEYGCFPYNSRIPWPSTGHATYIHYWPIRSSSVVGNLTTYRWCCRKVSATWWFCRTGWIDSPDLVASCSSANRSRTSLRLWSPRCSVSRTIPVQWGMIIVNCDR